MAKGAPAVVGHIGPISEGQTMSAPYALSALAALGQPTRLEIFRLLIAHEPAGLTAGVIAERIGCPQNTLSSHLAILARASLVRGSREGRSIVYRANVDGMRALIDFLVNDCCDGHPELCGFGEKAKQNACSCAAPGKKGRRR
jgi:DNA-binding transcriptional ArsR family regulator